MGEIWPNTNWFHVKSGCPPQVVGGFNPFEKYASQLGLFFSIYGKIIQVFQTTNQYKLANFDKPYSFHDL
jgi:hypothetical protein